MPLPEDGNSAHSLCSAGTMQLHECYRPPLVKPPIWGSAKHLNLSTPPTDATHMKSSVQGVTWNGFDAGNVLRTILLHKSSCSLTSSSPLFLRLAFRPDPQVVGHGASEAPGDQVLDPSRTPQRRVSLAASSSAQRLPAATFRPGCPGSQAAAGWC